jgi:hypothetical protein
MHSSEALGGEQPSGSTYPLVNRPVSPADLQAKLQPKRAIGASISDRQAAARAAIVE